MHSPNTPKPVFENVTETPRNLNSSEKKYVGRNIALAAAMMLATLENAENLGESDFFKENAPPAVQSAFSEYAKKKSDILASLPKMRYPTDEEVCMYRKPDGTIQIRMYREESGGQAEKRTDGTLKSTVLDFGSYSIRCEYVRKSDLQAAGNAQSSQVMSQSESRNKKPQKKTKKPIS